MGKKYIIDLNPDCVEGEYLRIPARIAGEEQWLVAKAALTPYTEPDLEQVRKEAYEDGYKTAKVQCNIQAEKDMREVGERHYQRGLADAKCGYENGFENGMIVAWEAARKICSSDRMTPDMRKAIFGWSLSEIVMDKFTASEAIEKLKAYEEQKEFHVGDEFENESGKRFVITKMNGTEIDRYIDEEGKTYCMIAKYKVIRKTGRHFPEIAEVLEKVRGDNND